MLNTAKELEMFEQGYEYCRKQIEADLKLALAALVNMVMFAHTPEMSCNLAKEVIERIMKKPFSEIGQPPQ